MPLQWPDLSIALRCWWWPALAYVVLSLLVTWPLVTRLSEARPGEPGDGSVFMWAYWFVGHSLSKGLSLWHTDLLFYPQGVSVIYNTNQWFNSLLAWPLQNWLGLTVSYNVIFLLAVASSAFSLYLLATSLCHHRLCGFAAGLAFGFSPYFLVARIEHQNLLAAQFLPLFALFTYVLLITGRARYVLLGGVSLALLGMCDWYYLVFGVVVAICLAIGLWWARGGCLALRNVLLLSVCILLGLLLLTPLLLPMMADRSVSRGMDALPVHREAYKADLFSYALPNLWHSLLPSSPQLCEQVLVVGWILLTFALLGLRRYWRLLYPWVVVLLVATFISWGPSLRVAGKHSYPMVVILMSGGLPGNGFDHPWATDNMVIFCRGILGQPKNLWCSQLNIPLPIVWKWLLPLFPPLQPFKCPARAGIVGIMVLALFAAVSMAAIIRNAEGCHRRRWAARLPILVALAVLVEYSVAPLPMYSTQVHPFYHWLAKDRDNYAILDVPLIASYSEYQFYQTVHQKCLFAGHLSRLVGHPDAFLQTSLLLHYLTAIPDGQNQTENALNLSTVPVAELRQAVVLDRLCRELRQLQQLDTRYILVHLNLLSEADQQATYQLLKGDLGLSVCYADSTIVVFELQVSD
jgi:hypothetical protein